MTKDERDRGDLRRYTIVWIAALIWLGAGYAFQDPARDAYDAAERAAFSDVMLVLIPAVTLAFVVAWIGHLRRRRS